MWPSSNPLEESKEEDNKLAALNAMIKKKQFVIQQEDEEDFEVFLQKLNQKRQNDIGALIEEAKSSAKPSERMESPVK